MESLLNLNHVLYIRDITSHHIPSPIQQSVLRVEKEGRLSDGSDVFLRFGDVIVRAHETGDVIMQPFWDRVKNATSASRCLTSSLIDRQERGREREIERGKEGGRREQEKGGREETRSQKRKEGEVHETQETRGEERRGED